jgi:hypothetical protein
VRAIAAFGGAVGWEGCEGWDAWRVLVEGAVGDEVSGYGCGDGWPMIVCRGT